MRAFQRRRDRGKRCPGRRDMMILVPGTSWARVLYSIHGQKSPAGDRIDPNAECTEVKRTESYKMRCRTRPGVPLSPRYEYFSYIFSLFFVIFRCVSWLFLLFLDVSTWEIAENSTKTMQQRAACLGGWSRSRCWASRRSMYLNFRVAHGRPNGQNFAMKTP